MAEEPMPLSEAARTRLHALQLAVEELQSRREDGVNDFTRDEGAVGRLLRALDAILNADTYSEGDALQFIETALQSCRPSESAATALQHALRRKLPSAVETFRVWLLFGLTTHGALMETLRLCLPMRDIVLAFYVDSSPLHQPDFVRRMLGLVEAVTMHPVHGPMSYRLDVSALTLFHAHGAEPESLVVRRRAQTVHSGAAQKDEKPDKPRVARRKTVKATHAPARHAAHSDPLDADASQEPRTPTGSVSGSQPGTARKPAGTFPLPSAVAVASVECQTDASGAGCIAAAAAPAAAPAPKPKLADRDSMTDDPAPGHTYEELVRLERVVAERDQINKQTQARLNREQEELEEARDDVRDREDALVDVLKSLKALYNHHFMLVKDADDSHRPIDRSRIDDVFLRVVAVLNGADIATGSNAPSASMFNTSGPLAPMAGAGSAVGGSGDDVGGASCASSPTQRDPRTGSFVYVSADGGRARLDSSVADGRTRTMSVLPPPESPPQIPRGSRPWRVAMFVEVERNRQLEIQHFRCPSCNRDLPNPNQSGVLARALQRAAKPRRCHYSGELYCHSCHTNQKSVIPFMAVQQWDFSERYVSNRDHEFLQSVFTKPMIHIEELPPDVRRRPLIVQAAQLRATLSRMYAILYTCPDARTHFGPQLGHYYFVHEKYYALKDLASIAAREHHEAGRSPASGIGAFLFGSQGVDLVTALQGLVKTGREHLMEKCHHCRSRSVKRCSLCGDADPVIMFENGTFCPDCAQPFHRACLALGCSSCDEKRHANMAAPAA